MFKAARILKHQGNLAYRSKDIVKSKYSSEGKLDHSYQIGVKLKLFCQTSFKRCLHQSPILYYPTMKELPLPLNIEDLASSEKLEFSPQRSRDINGSFISSSTSSLSSFKDLQSDIKNQNDARIECYDSSGVINLSSAMETNVPFPFISKGKPIHLNMHVGQWEQKEKYMSEDLNNVHPVNTRQSNLRKGTSYTFGSKTGTKNFYFWFPSRNLNYCSSFLSAFSTSNTCQFKKYCIMKDKIGIIEEKLEKRDEPPQLSRKEKLKVAVKDYGAVVLVFHVSISLMSLGCCYLLVASGIDISYILKEFGADEGGCAAGTAAHFVIAYAVHKTLAPCRIAVTLTAVPFIVKKLRKMGILKTPNPKPV